MAEQRGICDLQSREQADLCVSSLNPVFPSPCVLPQLVNGCSIHWLSAAVRHRKQEPAAPGHTLGQNVFHVGYCTVDFLAF